jgi:putative Mg2+ transporter-C (MgtC) family protein
MSSVWQISHLDLTIRMLLAVGMGGLIGLEREWSNHAAGLRTHMLVCIGATSIMLLSMYGFSEFANEFNVRMDPARLAAQVISGIGFLGAGAVLRNGSMVSGLTTAASIWVVAAIGLCIGAGFYYCAGLATGLVLFSLFFLNKWEKHLMRHRRNREVTICLYDRPGMLGKIATVFGEYKIQIVNVKMKPDEQVQRVHSQEPVMELTINIKISSTDKLLKAMESIAAFSEVVSLDSGQLEPTKLEVLGGSASSGPTAPPVNK